MREKHGYETNKLSDLIRNKRLLDQEQSLDTKVKLVTMDPTIESEASPIHIQKQESVNETIDQSRSRHSLLSKINKGSIVLNPELEKTKSKVDRREYMKNLMSVDNEYIRTSPDVSKTKNS